MITYDIANLHTTSLTHKNQLLYATVILFNYVIALKKVL